MEVPADADLLHLDFISPKDFSRAAKSVVSGMIEVLNVISVEPNFRGEELGISHRVFIARSAVEPSPVGIGERHSWLRFHGLGRRGITGRLRRLHRRCYRQ